LPEAVTLGFTVCPLALPDVSFPSVACELDAAIRVAAGLTVTLFDASFLSAPALVVAPDSATRRWLKVLGLEGFDVPPEGCAFISLAALPPEADIRRLVNPSLFGLFGLFEPATLVEPREVRLP
jgi:hypothetical protein